MMEFKFKWLDSQGNEQGFFSKKGSFDGTTLKLDELELPVAVLVEVDIRSNRMIFSTIGEDDEPAHLVIAITGGNAKALKEAIGVARSAAWAEMHREELVKQGRGSEFRAATCPHCTATIDLTGMPPTPQLSCEFCHALATLPTADAEGVAAAEKDYRLCDECGMYSKPRKFTIFYFYFLLVVYGYWQKETWRCPGCMRGEAWKMLLGNFLFVLGVPVALVQLFRSYGGSDIGSLFPGLDSANIKARNGRTKDAIEAYQKIIGKRPVSAGVKYNIGLAFLHDNDNASAAKMFEFALNDCANYRPAAGMLANCYEQLGEQEKLAELTRRWNADDDEQEMTTGDETADV